MLAADAAVSFGRNFDELWRIHLGLPLSKASTRLQKDGGRRPRRCSTTSDSNCDAVHIGDDSLKHKRYNEADQQVYRWCQREPKQGEGEEEEKKMVIFEALPQRGNTLIEIS